MNRLLVIATVLVMTTSVGLLKSSPARGEGSIEISPDADRPATAGPAETFTGEVQVKPLFNPNEYRNTGGAQVSFAPGARTAWHTHPAGQTLIVTEGTGWVQPWGGAKQQMNLGDVVWIPPGVKHWHGATATEAMTHIAMQASVDGSPVDWLEHVTNEQYLG